MKTKKFISDFLRQNLSNLGRWWHQYNQSKIGVAGLLIFIIMVLAIILAPVLATQDPTLKSESERFLPPSINHLMGTNSVGQDTFSELLYAGRVSLLVGVVAAFGVVAIGTFVGLTAGYFGGLVDEILTRICDVLLVIPRLPLMIILAAYLGPGIQNILLVLIVLGWTSTARKIRAQTLSAKQLGFVEAAKATGAKNSHIIINHILPNVSGIVIADFVLEILNAIMTESGLSFLGLGDPLNRSWGMMLYFAQQEGAFGVGAWWWWLFPGLAIALLSLACSFIGNTLNDRFVLRLGRIKSKSKYHNITHGKGLKKLFGLDSPKMKPEGKL